MKILFLCLSTLFIIQGCIKEDFTIENLNGNRITSLGHAGMGVGSIYPMNSFEGIMKCLTLGLDGTELDVQMTKDSVLVAFHSSDLADLTTLKGKVNSVSWSELKTANYISAPYLGYLIISLDDLFSNIPNVNSNLYTFDCKLYTDDANPSQFHETYIRALIAIIQKYDLQNNVCLESQDVSFLELLKKRMPGYRLFIYPSSFESGLDIAISLGLSGITISSKNISSDQVKKAHEHNILVALWNTHSASDNAEAIRKNPDYIQTDHVRSLLRLLN